MPKIVDLRQDRNLIRSNFDGYKLSLDPIPIHRKELAATPFRAQANDDQYSLLHVQLFSMQNLLQVDPWQRTSSYHVNRLAEIVRCGYNENSGQPEALQVVYRIPTLSNEMPARRKGDYNYSMRFISEKYCVVCNGQQTLWLLETGDRIKAQEWKQVAISTIASDDNDFEDAKNFVIYDCRLDIIQEQKQISLALGQVKRQINEPGSSQHFMLLHWAKWQCVENQWIFKILDALESKGSIYYSAFEPRAESLIISSNKPWKFQSQKQELCENVAEIAVQKPQLHNGAGDENMALFSWSQNEEDIVIKFNSLEDKQRSDYNIKCSSSHLLVECGNQTLLNADLHAAVDTDLTTWTMETNYLQITLVKKTANENWSALLANAEAPSEEAATNNDATMNMEQQPIANLEAPIEDCDFPMANMEDDNQIVRYHLSDKTETHAVILGATAPLFATCLRPGFPLALATRQDVDASLWLQQYNPSKPNEWSLRHEGNLHAFGYIQASKQQKKFMDCSPDLNYAVICESHRHLFLYKSNYDNAEGLRNRNGPQVSIGKQNLISLEDDTGEVLGMTTGTSVITLLTEKYILFLQIN